MKRTFIRLLAAAMLVLAAAIAFSGAAQAHATLVKCTIAANAKLASTPKTVTCTFAEGINPKGSFIGVFQATGDNGEVDKQDSAVPFSNAKQITLSLSKLAKGSYNLVWFTISADDGHRAAGYVPFSVTK